jgi:hypothetical protein
LQPWVTTVFAVIAVIVTVRKIWRTKRENKLRRQGRDGERIVAEQLEKLRAHGYRVLHDIVAGSFNLDHVVIGSAGIFVVETKTPSKSGRGNQIRFDGETVFINDRPFKSNPIAQAKGNARWLHEFLKDSTGKKLWVTPAILFPDWSVIRETKDADILVLNHKQFEFAVTNRPAVLTQEEISMAAFHLERFVRSKEST